MPGGWSLRSGTSPNRRAEPSLLRASVQRALQRPPISFVSAEAATVGPSMQTEVLGGAEARIRTAMALPIMVIAPRGALRVIIMFLGWRERRANLTRPFR